MAASLNLNDYLIEHQAATFFVRVTGNSMTGFGIHDGDLLVVDRSKTPADRQISVAVIDGAFAVKQLCRIRDGVLLRSHGSGHPSRANGRNVHTSDANVRTRPAGRAKDCRYA